MRDKNLTDDVIDEIITAPKTSLEQLLALELKHERKQSPLNHRSANYTALGWGC